MIKIFLLMSLFLMAFKVHDGDTFTMDNGDKIRLYGVDAPEMENRYMHCEEQLCTDKSGNSYRCANESKLYLEKLLSSRTVKCTKHGMSYKRIVGDCMADNFSVSGSMILAGWAVEDRRYSKGTFTKFEMIARNNRLGVWQGSFMMPWDYRRSCRK